MSASKSLSGTNEGFCSLCIKGIKGKKAKTCSECQENFCKDHVKGNDSFSSTCIRCYRSKVHLEVSMEMGSEIFKAKTHLNDLKVRLKNSKKDLEAKAAAIETMQKLLETNEKAHSNKTENYEKKIVEEHKRSDMLTNVTSSLTEALADCKYNERIAQEKLEASVKARIENSNEFDVLTQENNKYKYEVQLQSNQIKAYVPYASIKKITCRDCKKKIISSFKELIPNETYSSNSLITSTLSDRVERHSMISRESGKFNKAAARGPKDDSCNCMLF